MFSKSKYDVMESINVKSSMNLLFLVGKISKDLKQYENKKISKEEFNLRFQEVISKGIPSIKAICHIGYENSKDLVNVSEKELVSYLKREGLSLEEFRSNYMKMINTYVKVLLAFNIINKENIDIYKVMTPEVMLSLVKGDFSKLKSVIDELGVDISSENKGLIDRLVKDSFDISMLDNKEIKALESVHSKYMDTYVYSKVNAKEAKLEVLKYAKSLGKKKSVLEI